MSTDATVTARAHCPQCGDVQVPVPEFVSQPTTDDEYDTALSLVMTLHAIAAHLDGLGAA